ncbi:MAG: hypothetical protein Q4F15_04090 [Bacillota bacterium]|nr:hypothetical protein [Bacillota bacterium]
MELSAILAICAGIAVPVFIWVILQFSGRLMKGDFLEAKCRRINLFDPETYKMEIGFFNLLQDQHSYSRIGLVYRHRGRVYPYAEEDAAPFLLDGSKKAELRKSEDGSHCLELLGEGSAMAMYSFKKIENNGFAEGDKIYLRYFDERGKAHFARFEDGVYYSQLLQYKKRRWKDGRR